MRGKCKKHKWDRIIRANQKYDIYWCPDCGSLKTYNCDWYKGEALTRYYNPKTNKKHPQE